MTPTHRRVGKHSLVLTWANTSNPVVQWRAHFPSEVNESFYIQAKAEKMEQTKKKRYKNYLLGLHKKKLGMK